jgi:proliferating cell nuclear antigen
MPLGVNLGALMKVLKCAKDDDVCTLRASDDVDNLNLTYEARNSDRLAEYQMKLMDIDTDTLGIPDTDYDARVTMPSSELTRIVRDLSGLGESVKIEVSKEGVRFVAEGESANGSILLKQTEGARERYKDYGKNAKVKKEDGNEEGDEDEKVKVKKEKVKQEDDVEMEDEEEDAKKSNDEDGEEEVPEDEEDEESSSKKRKKAPAKVHALPVWLLSNAELLLYSLTNRPRSKRKPRSSQWMLGSILR